MTPASVATAAAATAATSATVATTTTPTLTAGSPHVEILYPTGTPTINHVDSVVVAYNSVWENANLTVFCELDQASDEWAMAEINYIQPGGTYTVAPIQAGMQIPQFPVPCGLLLYDSHNRSDYTTGGAFTMTSTAGVVSTYALTVTKAAGSSTTHPEVGTDVSTKTTASDRSRTATGTSTSTSATGQAGTTSVSSSAARLSNAGLSGGAKAGIAIGVVLGVCALVAAVFFFLRRKRQTGRGDHMAKLGSTASADGVAPTEKPVATAAQHPAPISTPVETAEVPVAEASGGLSIFRSGESHRNSEDWRRFFGNARSLAPSTRPTTSS